MENFQEQSHESWNEHEMKMRWKWDENEGSTKVQTWKHRGSNVKFWQYKAAIDQVFPAKCPKAGIPMKFAYRTRREGSTAIRCYQHERVYNEYQLEYVALQERQWRATGVQILQEIFMEYDRDRSGVAGLSMAQLCSTAGSDLKLLRVVSTMSLHVRRYHRSSWNSVKEVTRLWKLKSFAPC